MKNSIELERYNQHFYPIQDDSFEDLRHLVEFLSTDYRQYDQSLFEQTLSFYNTSFVYHDIVHKILYIGFSEWEVLTDIPVPCDSTFPYFLNDTNSCKITVQNFLEFIQVWLDIKKSEKAFAIVYRNQDDVIMCSGFDTQETMDFFVKDNF